MKTFLEVDAQSALGDDLVDIIFESTATSTNNRHCSDAPDTADIDRLMETDLREPANRIPKLIAIPNGDMPGERFICVT